MASTSRLVKRRQRSSCTSSPENHGEGDGGVRLQETIAVRDEMDMKDPGFSARNKRRRSDMSPHVCDATEEGQESSDEEFDVVHGEVAPKPVAKSATEILNPNRRSLRSRQSPVWKMSTSVIGTPVPRKARSAFVKGLHHDYPASGDINHQQHSNLAASEISKKTASSDDHIGKTTIHSGSVDQDIELEVAEVLFGLKRQLHHPDTARKSQEKPHVTNVKEPEYVKGDSEICTRKNKINPAEESGGLELKLAEKYEDGLVTEKIAIKGGEKDKSFSLKGYELPFESRNSGVPEAIPVAPLAECQAGKLEINFMVSPNQTAESISNSVEDSRWSPRDSDMKTMIKARKEMTKVKLEKQEKFTTDTGHLSVAVHDTSLPVQESFSGLEVTKTAHNTPASFPMNRDLCVTDSYMGQTRPRDTVAFIDNCSGSSTKGQSRKVSQNGRKRCATHYYVAQSIMCHQQCNRMSFPSSADGSSCSNVSGVSFVQKEVIVGQSQAVILKRDNVPSGTPNIAGSNCPRGKQTANEPSCLPDSAQRKKHLNHKSPQLSPSEKKLNAPALLFPANQYQMVGLNLERSGTSTSASSQKIAQLSKNATLAGGPTTGSTFLMTDPAMSFYNQHQAISEAQKFMTIIPNNGYPFPISTPVGNSGSFKGGGYGPGMPYYNGSPYPPQMFYHPQLHSQQPHSKTPILPSVQSANKSSHSSSSNKQHVQQQQHGPSVGGHTLPWPSAVHSKIPRKQIIQSSHQTCNPGVEIADKKPLVVDNHISNGERNAYNQQSQPLQQMNFNMLPMVAGNGNTKKFEQQESYKGPKVGIELPTSQAFSMYYSPFGGSNGASGMNFSLPPQNPPLFSSTPNVPHRTHLAPKTAVVSQKKYPTGGTSGIDFTSAVSDRKGTTGKPMSWVSQASPAFSKADPYDQTAMTKGCSILGSTTKTLSFNSYPENANDYQNRQHLQLLPPQHAQGIWNETQATNGQPTPGLSTYMSYIPVLMSHQAPWNSSVRSPVPQTTSTRPTLAKNPPHQATPLSSTTQFTLGGSNAKSLAAQGNKNTDMQLPYTLASSCQTPSPKSSHSSSRRNKPGAIASPTPQVNETCSSSPSQIISPSPVCRRNVPSILSNCPSQVSEVEH